MHVILNHTKKKYVTLYVDYTTIQEMMEKVNPQLVGHMLLDL